MTTPATPETLMSAVREAWRNVPAPPAEDLKYMAWGWGAEAERAFVGVAPNDVDIQSAGFFAATPLLDLPPRAAAAYLGPYLLAILDGLELQKKIGVPTDVLTRAHTITSLELPSFWERVVRPFLSSACRDVLAQVVRYLVSERKALGLTQTQVDTMVRLASQT